MHEAGISTEWALPILNQYLKRRYGYNLFDFALSVAIVLRKTRPLDDFNIWRLRKPSITDLRTVQTERDRLIAIRDRFIRDLKQHYQALSRIQNPLFPKEILPGIKLTGTPHERSLEFMITSVYGLDATITKEIEVLSASMNIFGITRGAPSTSINLLGCLWSLIMRERRRIHLEEIENLMGWFYERLEGTSYQNELRVYPSLQDISRFMGRHKKELEDDARKIFVHNYHIARPPTKIFPFSIGFEYDEPRFYARRKEVGNISRCLTFLQRQNVE